jgi:hypothetical protein
MKTRGTSLSILFAVSVFLSGCSMKVSGFITDAETDEPVSTAGVMVGKRYVHVDPAGHYEIKTRRYTKEPLVVVAKGYEKASVSVATAETRYPQVNVALTPTKRAAPVPAAAKPSPGPGPRTAP